MQGNIFYRTDYPDYLKKELFYRFNDPQGTPNGTHIAANIYSYNEKTKDFDFLSAIFGEPGHISGNNNLPAGLKSWQLTNHGTPATGTVTYSKPAAVGGFEPETPTITAVNIDLGGRLGQIAKASITITTTGLENLKILNESVTLIGNRIELFCRRTWPDGKTYNDEANRIRYEGRLYNFTFEKQDKGQFNIKLDLIGTAAALSEINALPIIDPKVTGYPSDWKKEYTVKDADTAVPVDNLLILLESIWDRDSKLDGSQTMWHEPVPGVVGVAPHAPWPIKPSIYIGKRPANRITDGTNHELQFYINLEGLRALVMKTIEIAAKATKNKQAEKLRVTYPYDTGAGSGAEIPWGSFPKDYLNSADPERILLFNEEIVDKGWLSDSTYYENPTNKKDRYPVSDTTGNIANIYISRTVIYDVIGTDINSKNFKSPGAKSIKSFFSAIFAEIKKQTGNWIDLALVPDLGDDPSLDGYLYIVDKNYVENDYNEPILQFALYPQFTRHYPDVAANNIALSAKVPASLAAKAFIKDANLTAAEEPVATPGDESDDTELSSDDIIKRINDFHENIASSDTIEEDNTTRRELMAKLKKDGIVKKGKKPAGEILKDISKTQNIQTTLDMSITSYGINGWSWGHACKLDFIPSTAPKNTVFSINKISHTISNDKTSAATSKWETKIECLARLRPESEAAHVLRVGQQTSPLGNPLPQPPGYVSPYLVGPPPPPGPDPWEGR
jgi:hypothetical protein